MLFAPVLLPDPLGDRPIELRPTLRIWLAIEKLHGGSIGNLLAGSRGVGVSLAMQIDLLYRCAREAGSSLTWEEIGARVHRLGLFVTTPVVLELFGDIFVATTPEERIERAEGESEGVPLAGGG